MGMLKEMAVFYPDDDELAAWLEDQYVQWLEDHPEEEEQEALEVRDAS